MFEDSVKNFLAERVNQGSPLLLGLSGGADSMALFHLLLEAQKKMGFILHIAHIDHGWRKESHEEGESLREVAAHFKIPFHLHRLEKMEGGDLENRCRNERLNFFHRLHQRYGYQALLLGHHAGDQAETVFKRIAEGSGLKGLGGLSSEKILGNLKVWRPLLSTKKERLIAYLKKKEVAYFEDYTNQDPSYLRSRMREALFPYLEQVFEKKMEGNFVRLGKMCQELSEYFEGKRERIQKLWVVGPFGAYLDLTLGIEPLELKYYLKESAPISYDALEVLMALIHKKRFDRFIHAGEITFYLTPFHLFMYQNPFPDFFKCPELWKEGKGGDWKSFWLGEIQKIEPTYYLENISNLDPLLRKKVKKWYALNKVPSFFNDKAPLLMKEGILIKDYLTGKKLNASFIEG